MLAEQEAAKVDEPEETNTPEIPDSSEEITIGDKEVDDMDIDQVRGHLDDLGVKYPKNTGLAKLKERLKDAIK